MALHHKSGRGLRICHGYLLLAQWLRELSPLVALMPFTPEQTAAILQSGCKIDVFADVAYESGIAVIKPFKMDCGSLCSYQECDGKLGNEERWSCDENYGNLITSAPSASICRGSSTVQEFKVILLADDEELPREWL